MRILGVDPGTNFLGYAIIETKKNKISLLTIGVVSMKHLGSHQLKLKKIFERLQEIIRGYNPDHMAIEAPFYGKNVQSMLKLGRAQGVAIAAAITMDVEMTEYAPKKIKQSITGNGNASKEQVAAMLKSLMKIEEMPKHLDATDGLAAAVCHYFQGGVSSGDKKYSSWESFVKNNPKKAR